MKRLAAVIILLLWTQTVDAQAVLTAFGSTVEYAEPDTALWHLDQKGVNEQRAIAFAIYKRDPIVDSEGRKVIPNIMVMMEQVGDSLGLVEYSAMKRIGQSPWQVIKVHSPGEGVSYSNTILYDGQYQDGQDVLHHLIMAHMRHGVVGVQVIGDATEEVFSVVEAELREFVRSVVIHN